MHTLYRALLLLLAVLPALGPLQGATPENPSGRNLLGVYLTGEGTDAASLPDLDRFVNAGIGVVELKLPVSSGLLNQVAESSLLVLARQQRRFVTSADIQREDSLYLSEDQEWITRLSDRLGSRFIAYAPFTYPNDLTPRGVEALDEYAGKVTLPEGLVRLYYLSATPEPGSREFTFRALRHSPDSPSVKNATVFLLSTDDPVHLTLNHFYQLLEHSLQMDESIILLPQE